MGEIKEAVKKQREKVAHLHYKYSKQEAALNKTRVSLDRAEKMLDEMENKPMIRAIEDAGIPKEMMSEFVNAIKERGIDISDIYEDLIKSVPQPDRKE